MTVGIVGLGLIGGSLAKSIKARTDHTVLGLDTDGETMALARMSGAIDGQLLPRELGCCDVVLAALAPAALVAWTEENVGFMSGTVLVDMCGVKREICGKLALLAERHGFKYVGGHPMAGIEVSGFKNASGDLFTGAPMILTPDEGADAETLDLLKTLFLQAGFERIVFSAPDAHDRTIAYTSQLAHVVSSAYIKSPAAMGHSGFSAGSFRDMTRVAKLDEVLWTELFLLNADYLAAELELLLKNLTPYLAALKNNDADGLRALLREGRERKAASEGCRNG